ncbi:MAG: hypothetical protein GY946_05560 [bacterium]|nr:hypothetical protein [bacterium]
MSEPKITALGWTERLYAAVPLSPGYVGVALASAFVFVFAAIEFALGRHLVFFEVSDAVATEMINQARTTVANFLFAAFMPTAYVYLLRSYRSTLDQLRSHLDGSDAEFSALRSRIGHYAPTALALSIIGGLGIVLLLTRATTPAHVDPWEWGSLIVETRWMRVLSPWHGCWLGVLFLSVGTETQRLAPLAARIVNADLPDLVAFRPFTRQALLNTLLMFLASGFGWLTIVESGSLALVLGYWVAATAGISIGLVFWLAPVYLVVREMKARELDWCRDALVREGAKLRQSDAGPSRIGELVAWESRVESVPNWPIDASALRTFLLYSLIPLVSWAGGALVERFIDLLLD